jgi:hypothetical protein
VDDASTDRTQYEFALLSPEHSFFLRPQIPNRIEQISFTWNEKPPDAVTTGSTTSSWCIEPSYNWEAFLTIKDTTFFGFVPIVVRKWIVVDGSLEPETDF